MRPIVMSKDCRASYNVSGVDERFGGSVQPRNVSLLQRG
jgi:hypothetical protein